MCLALVCYFALAKVSSGSRGGPRGPWPPPGPVKIGHKKDGRRRQPHRFHVSRPPTYPAAGSATEGQVFLKTNHHCHLFLFFTFLRQMCALESDVFLFAMDTHIHSLSSVLITPCQRSYGKVMFSVVCVCHSVCPRGGGFHVTIAHGALDLTVQCPLCPQPTSDMGPPSPSPSPALTPTASEICWLLLETCSNLFT